MGKDNEQLTISDMITNYDSENLRERLREITGARRIPQKAVSVYKEILLEGRLTDEDLKIGYAEVEEFYKANPEKRWTPNIAYKLKSAAIMGSKPDRHKSLMSNDACKPESVEMKTEQIHMGELAEGVERFQSPLTSILEKAYSSMSSGLFLFPLPTGIGKSFSASEEMVELWLKGELVWFVTGRLENLKDPIENLLKAAKRRLSEGDYRLFEKSIINFRKIEDSWKNFLGEKYKKGERDSQKRIAAFAEIKGSAIAESENASSLLRAVINSFNAYLEYPYNDTDDSVLNKLHDADRALRIFLKSQIGKIKARCKDEDGNYDRGAFDRSFDSFLEENSWIEKVYPYVNVHKRRDGHAAIVFCSVSKTAFRADDLVNPNSFLFKQIAEMGGVCFIDEIDQSKAIYRGHLLDVVLCNKFLISSILRDGFTEKNMHEIVDAVEDENEKKNLIDVLKKAEQIIANIETEYGKIVMRREFEEDFFDNGKYHFIIEPPYRAEPNRPVKYTINENGTVLLGKYDNNVDSYNQRLESVLSRLTSYIEFFFNVAPTFLKKLAGKKNRVNSFDQNNISAFLSLCGFMRGTDAYKYAENRLNQPDAPVSEQIPFDSIYSHGISVTMPMYIDAESETNTIASMSVELSPEAILAHMARSCLVIGMSATANFETVIDNYNYEWIKNAGINVRTVDDEDRMIIKKVQEKRFRHLDKVSFECGPISGLLEEDEDIELRIRPVCDKGSDDYNHLIKLVGAFQRFALDGKHTAGMAFMNKYYAGKGSDNPLSRERERVLREIFEEIDPFIKVYFVNAKTYDREMQKAVKELSEGNAVFIIALYQSTATGINPDYPVTGTAVRTSAEDYIDGETVDFDFLYFAKRTGVLPFEDRDKYAGIGTFSRTLSEQAYITEEIYENGEISPDERKEIHIDFMDKGKLKLEKQSSLASFQGSCAISLAQGAGRCDRAVYKRENVGFYFDIDYADVLDADYLQLIISKNELNPHTESFFETIADYSNRQVDISSREENRMSRIATCSLGEINRSFGEGGNIWDHSKISTYRDMRKFSLTNPTSNSESFDTLRVIEPHYLKKDGRDLFYKISGRDITIRKECQSGFRHLGIEQTNVDTLLKEPRVRSFFMEHGYSVEWDETAEYIMSPGLMTNLYMGAAGEEAFKAIFGFLGLEEREDPRIFELFDFYVKNIGIDIKNYSPERYRYQRTLYEEANIDNFKKRIAFKAGKADVTAAMYINIVDDENRSSNYHTVDILDKDGKVERTIEVFSLAGVMDRNGVLKQAALRDIREFIEKHAN